MNDKERETDTYNTDSTVELQPIEGACEACVYFDTLLDSPACTGCELVHGSGIPTAE